MKIRKPTMDLWSQNSEYSVYHHPLRRNISCNSSETAQTDATLEKWHRVYTGTRRITDHRAIYLPSALQKYRSSIIVWPQQSTTQFTPWIRRRWNSRSTAGNAILKLFLPTRNTFLQTWPCSNSRNLSRAVIWDHYEANICNPIIPKSNLHVYSK